MSATHIIGSVIYDTDTCFRDINRSAVVHFSSAANYGSGCIPEIDIVDAVLFSTEKDD